MRWLERFAMHLTIRFFIMMVDHPVSLFAAWTICQSRGEYLSTSPPQQRPGP